MKEFWEFQKLVSFKLNVLTKFAFYCIIKSSAAIGYSVLLFEVLFMSKLRKVCAVLCSGMCALGSASANPDKSDSIKSQKEEYLNRRRQESTEARNKASAYAPYAPLIMSITPSPLSPRIFRQYAIYCLSLYAHFMRIGLMT